MAGKDLSKTFEDIESEDLSLETSIPTDITMSPDHSEAETRNKKRHISKQIIERKQMIHDLQLLKIELSQKNLAIENMKVEHVQVVEDLTEKLHDLKHQKQILQARLESELQIQSDEAKKRQDIIKRELDAVQSRQQQLEAANARLQEKTGEVRQSLKDFSMSEERYYQLRGLPDDDISLRDFVALRVFEAMKPVQTELSQLRDQNKSLEDDVTHLSKSVLDYQKKLEIECQAHGELRVKYQKLNTDFAETTVKVKSDDYKVENYDKVKSDRDLLESTQMELSRQLMSLEASYTTLQKERDDLSRDFSATKQSITLLKQDKEYLTRQLTEASNKSLYSEERLQQAISQLDHAKTAREEMYEKYIVSRDQYKSEYENKLKEELEQIRVRTNGEIDRLRTSTREMYERENRNLREARDLAISERDRAQCCEREMNTKYEQLLGEHRATQSSGESRVSEIQNELKIKMFEAERAQLVHAETAKNLTQVEMEVEKLQKKLEVLTKEYYSMQTTLEKKIVELEGNVSEKNTKLESYEKMEQELDSIILQAAEVEDDKDAERVLFSYGYGANVASTTKRRMQQSVHLAKRVLQLEKTNTSLRKDIQEHKNKSNNLLKELEKTNGLLDQSQQPYSYLIDSIRVRDNQLTQQEAQIGLLTEDLRLSQKEKEDLTRTHTQMSLDLEKLLNQKEEMAVMKQVVLSLSERQLNEKKTKVRDFRPGKGSNSLRSKIQQHGFELSDNPNVVKPGSLHMSRARSPQRAKQNSKASTLQTTKFSRVYGVAKS